MRRTPRERKIAGMGEQRIAQAPSRGGRLRVTLDFDSAEEPISGSLRDVPGSPRLFTGWLGLLCTLESALASGARARERG